MEGNTKRKYWNYAWTMAWKDSSSCNSIYNTNDHFIYQNIPKQCYHISFILPNQECNTFTFAITLF